MNRGLTAFLFLSISLAPRFAAAAPNLVPAPTVDGSKAGWGAYMLDVATDPTQACAGHPSLRFQMLPFTARGLTIYLFPVNRGVEATGEAFFDDVRLTVEGQPDVNLLRNGDAAEQSDSNVVGWDRAGKPCRTARETTARDGRAKTCIYNLDDEPEAQEYVTQGLLWREEWRGKKLTLSAWVRSPKGAGTCAMQLADGTDGIFKGFNISGEWQQVTITYALPAAGVEPLRNAYANLSLPVKPDPAKYYRFSAWLRAEGKGSATLSLGGLHGAAVRQAVASGQVWPREFSYVELIVHPSHWRGDEDGMQIGLTISGFDGDTVWLAAPALEEVSAGDVGLAAFTDEGRQSFEHPRGLAVVARPQVSFADLAPLPKLQGRDFWHLIYDSYEAQPGVRDLPMIGDCAHRLSHFAFWRPLKTEFERVPAASTGPVVGQCVGVELVHGAFFDNDFCRTGVPPGMLGKGGGLSAHGADRVFDGDPSASSAWWSGGDCPQWLTVELKEPATISKVRLVTFYGDGRYYQYRIDASPDGKTWTGVADESANTRPAVPEGMTHTFPALMARFVKVTVLRNSANLNAHIAEIEVFDEAGKKTAIASATAQSTQDSDLPNPDMRPLSEKMADLHRFYKDRFLGLQIGEWGNAYGMMLNWGDQWTRSEYWGRSFADVPNPPLAKPRNRREGCEGVMREFRRIADLFGGDVFFMNCSRMWDHYGLELGGTMAFPEYECCYHLRELQIAFARGAAGQYGRPWGVYSSTFLGQGWLDYSEHAPGTKSDGGPDGGRSLSCLRREHFLTYMSGASLYEGQTWCLTTKPSIGEPQVTPYGRDYIDFYRFTRRHPDRGRPFAPVAVLLDFVRGDYAPVVNAAWNTLPLEAEDFMMNETFRTFFPYVTPQNREYNGVCLTNSPFGNIVDVLKPNPPSGVTSLAVLRRYPVAVMAGGFDMTQPLAQRLMDYVRQGGTLVINVEHLGGRFPADFLGVRLSDDVRTAVGFRPARGAPLASSHYRYRVVKLAGAQPLYTTPDGDPVVTRHTVGKGAVVLSTPPYLLSDGGAALSCMFDLLRELAVAVTPVRVYGDIEFALGRLPDGWVVTLVNNKGVAKDPLTPPVVDPARRAEVRIVLPPGARRAVEWTSGADRPLPVSGGEVRLRVDPGDVRVVRLAG
jgi:hypothetical protein